MNETTFSREVRKALEINLGDKIYLRKIVQNGFMTSGLPDNVGSFERRFIGIESKFIRVLPKNGSTRIGIKFSDDQIKEAQRINAAGGRACGLVCIHEYKIAIIINPNFMADANELRLMDLEQYNNVHKKFTIHREKGSWNVTNLISYLKGE